MSEDEVARDVRPVTPSANALPGGTTIGLMVTVAGNLNFTARGGGNSGTFAVTAGQIIPVEVAIVGTATTATVLALY